MLAVANTVGRTRRFVTVRDVLSREISGFKGPCDSGDEDSALEKTDSGRSE
jgi:hypothetical protein